MGERREGPPPPTTPPNSPTMTPKKGPKGAKGGRKKKGTESYKIDIEPEESMLSIKKKLEEATGVPVGEQKVMLAGLDELMMGDKRTNIKFGKCGTSSTAGMAI